MLYSGRQWPQDVRRKGEHALSSCLQGGKVVVQDRTETALPETRHWLNQSPFGEGVTVTCKRHILPNSQRVAATLAGIIFVLGPRRIHIAVYLAPYVPYFILRSRKKRFNTYFSSGSL